MVEKINILNIPISNIRKEKFLHKIEEHFKDSTGNLFIVTANPEIIMLTKESKDYQAAVLNADYVLPDGIGVIIASKLLKQPLEEKIPGYELLHDLLAYARAAEKRVYFYGAKPGIAGKAAEKAFSQYPGLQMAGTMDGYSSKGQEAADKIAATNPDFIFVAMGAPLQDQWIATYRAQFPNAVLVGVGGSFDVLSGTLKRAPKFWTNNNLEWLYRLITQPTRAKRMMKIPVFLVEVLKTRARKK